jgi:PAS domain S-box-containing protein
MHEKTTYEELERRVHELEASEIDYILREAEMQQHVERLELAIKGTGVGLWDYDMLSNHVHFSPQWKRMLGYDDNEIEHTFEAWKALWHPDDIARIENAINTHVSGNSLVYEIEHRLRQKDGSWRWILSRGDIVRDADGTPLRWVGTHLDINERKNAEAALRENQAFLSRIINENPFPIWIGDHKGTIIQCNQALLDFLKLEEHQLVGIYNIQEDPLIAHLRDGIRDIFEKGKTWKFEVEWQAEPSIGARSEWVVIAGAVFPIFDHNGEIMNTVATYQDISALKDTEHKLHASLEQQKSLTQHLQTIREAERTNIARELHDELAQVLTAINHSVYAIAREIPSKDLKLKEKAKGTSQLVTDAIRSTRRIIYELRPALLEDLGLAEAIRYHIRECESHFDLNFKVTISPDDIILEDQLSLAVFRILQEAVTNAVRHSQAKTVAISLTKTDATIHLEVKDDGIGIREDQLSQRGSFGILGIQERAEVFGGTVDISGVPQKGTRLTLHFPIQ